MCVLVHPSESSQSALVTSTYTNSLNSSRDWEQVVGGSVGWWGGGQEELVEPGRPCHAASAERSKGAWPNIKVAAPFPTTNVPNVLTLS